jgi:hypothetical protein
VMYLSYSEIMNLIQKKLEKHQERLKEDGPQVDKDYHRHAIFAIKDLEKEIRKHLAKKYK